MVSTDMHGGTKWSGTRFHYTVESGIVCPTQYMVWTLLAYWAVTTYQDLRSGLLCSPCSSLIKKLKGGRFAKSWGKTQQGFVARLTRAQILANLWQLQCTATPTRELTELDSRDAHGQQLAALLAQHGAKMVPSISTASEDLDFVHIQRSLYSPHLWTWMDGSTGLFALTDTVTALHRHNRRLALIARDKDRKTLGNPKKWSNGDSLAYAGRLWRMHSSGIAQRAADGRTLHERHYTVNTMPAKKIKDPEARLIAEPVSYTHLTLPTNREV